jgi:hypothetical protein
MAVQRQEQTDASDLVLMALFARMDTAAISAGMAAAFALGLATATAVLLLAGAPPGVPIGPNLSALGNIFPGYSVTWLGCLVGAAWAGVVGAVTGFLVGTFWNLAHIVSLALIAVFYPPPSSSSLATKGIAEPKASYSPGNHLLGVAVRLNVVITAVGVGLGVGLLFLLAANLSMAVSNHPGRYLNLFGVFMPGYETSAQGAWFGLLWGLIYGALSGGAITILYEHRLGPRLPELVVWDEAAVRQLRTPVLRIASHTLGWALGVVVAFQLLLATWWLVLRGTADQSVHAKLLVNYLPGYTVSWQGALLGGLELFFVVYLFTMMAGQIYNLLVSIRHA